MRSLLTISLSLPPEEALPGLIWDLGQQLGDLSLESGGLEQESGRSSGKHGLEVVGSAWTTPPRCLLFHRLLTAS